MSKTAIVIFDDGYKKPYENVPDNVFNSPDGGESAILNRAKKDYPNKTVKTWGIEGKEQQPPRPATATQKPPEPSTKPAPADSAINDVVAQKQKDWEAKAKAEQEAKAKADSDRKEKEMQDLISKKEKESTAKQEPAKVEPAKSEPAKVEPTKAEPAKAEPAKVEPAKTEPAKTEPAKVEPTKTEPKPEEPAGPSLWDRIKGAVSGGSSSDKAPGAEAPATTTAPTQSGAATTSAPAQQSTTSAPASTQPGATSTGKDRLAAFKQRHGIEGGGAAGPAGTVPSTGKEQGPGQKDKPGKDSGVNSTTSNTPGPGTAQQPGTGTAQQPGKQPGKQPGEAPGAAPGKKPGEGNSGEQQWRPTPVKKGYWVDIGRGFRQWTGDNGVDPNTGKYIRSGTIDVTPVWKGDDDLSKIYDPEELRRLSRLQNRDQARKDAAAAAAKSGLQEQREKLNKALKLGKK